MTSDTRLQQRLTDLDGTLVLYYEKLKMFQDELAITSSADAKFALKKRIEREIIPYINQYETDYASLLAAELNELEMSDEEADIIIGEIQAVVISVKETAQEKQSEVLMKSAEKIEKVLEKPISSKGKLQAAIPIIPGIITYQLELEFDPYNSLMSLWRKIKDKLKI